MSKKIGIITGIGATAGVRFYDMVVKECQRKGAKLDSDFPEIVIVNISSKGMDETGITNEDIIKDDIKDAIEYVNIYGAEKILIACNTVHIYLRYFQKHSKALIVNMPEIAVSHCGNKKYGVISSKSSKQLGLYSKAHIQTTEKQQETIDNLIKLVIKGQFDYEEHKKLQNIITSMQNNGAEYIILGCTEIPCIYPGGGNIIDGGELAVKELLK